MARRARRRFFTHSVLLTAVFFASGDAVSRAEAADQPQWGEPHTRNMVSSETNLPTDFDPATGKNIRWTASLGSNAYGTPTIGGGCVLVGANNSAPRDPRHQGDRGVLLCLDERDGSLRWQMVVPRIDDDIYKDWPNIGLCSPPTIDGDRVYTLTNRFEVVCLDLAGQANGNDGPYVDEGRHMAPATDDAMAVTPIDADIVWLFDMLKEVGSYPHDASHSSILVDGDYLYINTCNGVDNTHAKIRAPEAPSLIVLEKKTGRLVARDGEGIGPRIFHSTWSSPAMGEVDGNKRIFFCGGDGVCYTFAAIPQGTPPSTTRRLDCVGRFDCDPTAPKDDVHSYLRNGNVSPTNVKSMPVFDNGRLYVTCGGDIWWGKREAWLLCIDATKTGDMTESGRLWTYPVERHCCSTPSVYQGMIFVPDCRGTLHCVDVATGKAIWTHDLGSEVWGSTLVADGKVYVGTNHGDLWILDAAREKHVVNHVVFHEGIPASPVAANGVLYVTTLERLYAIAADAR